MEGKSLINNGIREKQQLPPYTSTQFYLGDKTMSKSIYTHKHHIVPRHAGGSNDPSNIEVLTIPEHALAHKKLYEEYGRWQDEVAYLTLSGQIDNAEATKRAQREANLGSTNFLGKTHTPEASKKISDAQKVNMIGNKRALGHKKTDECKKILSQHSMGKQNALGSKHSDEYKKNKSIEMKGNTNGLGYKHSDEYKKQKSIEQSGKKRGPYRKRKEKQPNV